MKKLSLKIQITALSVSSLILLTLISTYVAGTKSKDALIDSNNKTMSIIRDAKKSQIEAFFHENVRNIDVLSKSGNIAELVNDMLHIHNVLGVGAT
ncbi:MAG: hypothetical protein AABY36_00465 [Campylobacterota bacterium]